MANQPDYSCTKCGNYCGRELLTVKKISFVEMGIGGRVLKSRVKHWLCPNCVKKDEDFNLEPFRAPGNVRVPKDTLLG